MYTNYSHVYMKLIYIIIEQHAVNKVFAHELRQYNREGEHTSTYNQCVWVVEGVDVNVEGYIG